MGKMGSVMGKCRCGCECVYTTRLIARLFYSFLPSKSSQVSPVHVTSNPWYPSSRCHLNRQLLVVTYKPCCSLTRFFTFNLDCQLSQSSNFPGCGSPGAAMSHSDYSPLHDHVPLVGKDNSEETHSESDDRFSGTTLGSTRFRGSTNLIPSPGSGGTKPPKRFVRCLPSVLLSLAHAWALLFC